MITASPTAPHPHTPTTLPASTFAVFKAAPYPREPQIHKAIYSHNRTVIHTAIYSHNKTVIYTAIYSHNRTVIHTAIYKS